jgi:hypothetical protein|tara:strand:- start:30282 stop:30389 length:108 start_codon:yes stop_codon:yes gene_type:complete
MEANYLEEKKPNLIQATYQLAVGVMKLIAKTFFTF